MQNGKDTKQRFLIDPNWVMVDHGNILQAIQHYSSVEFECHEKICWKLFGRRTYIASVIYYRILINAILYTPKYLWPHFLLMFGFGVVGTWITLSNSMTRISNSFGAESMSQLADSLAPKGETVQFSFMKSNGQFLRLVLRWSNGSSSRTLSHCFWGGLSGRRYNADRLILFSFEARGQQANLSSLHLALALV